ncbi:peptidase [Lysobacter pythonis]|uniref:Peptidase n=1 Tax=Solilutibacter pythonis TaxID=2483112 RepID=A0A3M2I145_9GAMM|nr:PepSY-associated TM helix domain-containing protein [Lysobacter pythonis]RMH93873.1 peptidase [Lysobacter pythonis]
MWFDLHSWIGLKLFLFMAFICLTGTLATLAHEIDWLIQPAIRVQPDGAIRSWGDQLDAVRHRHPEWKIVRLSAPEGRYFAAKAEAKPPGGRTRFVWVDPWRAHVTGDTGWFNAHRLLRNTHRHLMMPTRYGVPLVSSLSIALLLSFASSLVIYKKWWKGFLSRPRGPQPRRFWGDIHRLAGVWSLGFVLLIALTGLWYLVESLGGAAPHAHARPLADAPANPAPPPGTVIDGRALDRIIASAKRVWPQLRIASVALDEKTGTVTLEGQAAAILVRDRVNQLRYRVGDALPHARIDGTTLSFHQRVSEMADPLHFGNFAGLALKLVWCFFGGLMTLLSFTGVYLYGMRTLHPPRAAAR